MRILFELDPGEDLDFLILRSPWGTNKVPRAFRICLLLLAAIWIVEWSLYFWHPADIFNAACGFLSPMAEPAIRFSDLTNILPRVREFGHEGMLTRPDLGLPYPYPIPSVFAFLLFSRDPVPVYVAFSAFVFVGAASLFAAHLWRQSRLASIQIIFWPTLFLFHPTWFLIDRGNIEIVIWVLIAGGVFLFAKQRSVPAAVLFAIAASMKIYPSLLCLLFWKRREKVAIMTAIGVFISLTVGSYWLVGPSMAQAFRDSRSSAVFMSQTQLAPLQPHVLRWDHSVFAFAKHTAYLYRHRFNGWHEDAFNFNSWIRPYTWIAVIAFAAVYLLRLRCLPLLNQVIALIILAILLPFVSYDYTLVHLSIVYACLFVYALERSKDKTFGEPMVGSLVGLLLALTFSPLTNLALRHYGGQLKCVCLIGLLLLVLKYPMPSKLFEDAESRT